MNINFFDLIFLKNWYLWLILIAIFMLKQLFKMYKPAIKGAFGETVFGLTSSMSFGNDWHILKNIVIPAYDGTTQIDQIAISEYGIFIIEIKTYKGWIFGKERDAKWTQTLFKEKHSFQNPLFQNYKHVRSLQELTGISESKFKSVIVFSGEAVFKTPMPRNVVKGTAYIDYIKSFKDVILTEYEIGNILKTIFDNRLSGSDHRKYIRDRKENYHNQAANPTNSPNKGGFCIRCRKQIRKNAKQPYCYDCYKIWNKYKNKNYRESYCHACGKENVSNMNKPVCYNCYKSR
ncbi:nuclease-related domain-containing protein [Desulfococcaceae bacterium HSG8]|nr:nuclease-related domain-containing protein [Desulfococcaceae bacterium HSG8]